MTGRTFITIANVENGSPLAIYREGHRAQIVPGQKAAFSVPEGFCLSVTEEGNGGKSCLKETRSRLRLWQAAAFMAFAALILSMASCAGPTARRDARAWSSYAQGAAQIMQEAGR